jgi:predicted MFS family arabinose efflux permease
VVSRSWGTLVPFAVLAGAGLAIVQPATDLWVSRTLPASRQGFGFGAKQAAGRPGVGLLAGLAVPVVAATLGWRAAFVIGAVGAAGLVLALGTSREPPRPARRGVNRTGDVALGPLVVTATAAAIGVMSQTAFVGFVVSAAVAAGMAESTAGLLFAAGSALGLVIRITLGHLADRRVRRPLVTCAGMMGSSALGFVLLATERHVAVGVAMLLLCATAWGWQGLFFLAVARSNPNAPAAASGIAATGMLSGAVLGPILFGVLARDEYALAWLACAVSGLAAAALALVSHRLLSR